MFEQVIVTKGFDPTQHLQDHRDIICPFKIIDRHISSQKLHSFQRSSDLDFAVYFLNFLFGVYWIHVVFDVQKRVILNFIIIRQADDTPS